MFAKRFVLAIFILFLLPSWALAVEFSPEKGDVLKEEGALVFEDLLVKNFASLSTDHKLHIKKIEMEEALLNYPLKDGERFLSDIFEIKFSEDEVFSGKKFLECELQIDIKKIMPPREGEITSVFTWNGSKWEQLESSVLDLKRQKNYFNVQNEGVFVFLGKIDKTDDSSEFFMDEDEMELYIQKMVAMHMKKFMDVHMKDMMKNMGKDEKMPAHVKEMLEKRNSDKHYRHSSGEMPDFVRKMLEGQEAGGKSLSMHKELALCEWNEARQRWEKIENAKIIVSSDEMPSMEKMKEMAKKSGHPSMPKDVADMLAGKKTGEEVQLEKMDSTANLGQYLDIKGHWAEKEIRKNIQRKLIRGYPDQEFKPNQEVTRAELAAILIRLIENKNS